jgi:hypothetical protein
MVSFCFSCGTPCKTQKGLENHVKSLPKCLHDLGIACAESLGLSPSFPSAQPINHHSSDDDSSIPGDGLDFLDAPSLVDDGLPNNDFDVGKEERMSEQAKMYTDRGNGCFTNEEILSIRLLGIMRDIGAPLKKYGRIVALFKDVITDREPITTTFRQRHTTINHFSE